LYAFVGYFFLPERIYWGPAVFAPGTIPEVMDTITSWWLWNNPVLDWNQAMIR
jgi:hypothetical protein